MTDEDKTREQLLEELEVARQRIAELESTDGPVDSTVGRDSDRLKFAHLLLQSSVEGLPDLVVVSVDRQFRVLYFNKALLGVMRNAYGTHADIKEGVSLLDCISDANHRSHSKEFFGRALSGESHSKIVERGADEQRRYFETIYGPIIDEEGEVIGATAFAQDITERKRLEEKLADSERRFRAFTEVAPVGVFESDVDGNTTYWNDLLCAITGMSVGEGKGTGWADGIHPDDRERIFNKWYESSKARADFDEEFRFIDRTGKITHTLGRAKPLKDTSGNWCGSIGTITDITEHKQAEDALRVSEERFHALVGNIPGASYRCRIDEDWTMLFISDEIKRISGFPASDFVQNRKRSYSSIMNPEDAMVSDAAVIAAVERKEAFTIEYRVVRADGEVRWVLEKGNAIFDERGEPLYLDGVILEITDRKRAEAERERLILELREALEQVKTLRGIVPICTHCKKIRDDEGYWHQVEVYVRDHTEAEFSHGLCVGCIRELYPEMADEVLGGKDLKE